MLEINARAFLAATTEMRMVIALIDRIEDKNQAVPDDDRGLMAGHLARLIEALSIVNARSALAPANRLNKLNEANPPTITYFDVQVMLSDVESRFADHLDDVRMFVIPDQRAHLMGEAAQIMNEGKIVTFFPSATFELEEAGKCLALGRPTACAFHAMRMLEIGIDALRKFLGVPDPVKATDRSWGNVLGSIKDAIDAKYPKKGRVKGSPGTELEALYATLDAVKNPWRNATMHVETKYTEDDAQHILSCSMMFMRKLIAVCDENGTPAEVAELIG